MCNWQGRKEIGYLLLTKELPFFSKFSEKSEDRTLTEWFWLEQKPLSYFIKLLVFVFFFFLFLPKGGNLLPDEWVGNWKYDRITEDNKTKCNLKRPKIISDLYINNEATWGESWEASLFTMNLAHWWGSWALPGTGDINTNRWDPGLISFQCGA